MPIRTSAQASPTLRKKKRKRRGGGGGCNKKKRRVIILILFCFLALLAWIFCFMNVVVSHYTTSKDHDESGGGNGNGNGSNTGNNNNNNNQQNNNRSPAGWESLKAKFRNRIGNNNNNKIMGKGDNNNKEGVEDEDEEIADKGSTEQDYKVKLPIGGQYDSPLVIFTCKRSEYLKETLTDILHNILPSSKQQQNQQQCKFGCPIIISEDGYQDDVDSIVIEFQQKFEQIGVPLYKIRHQQKLHLYLRGGKKNKYAAYESLAQHYGWALKEIFNGNIDTRLPQPNRVIILEEDINIAPDFFTYMEATSKLLDDDPTLFAVSAFNDNGHLVKDPTRLLRSDFFPGLGWMMTRKLWKNELEIKWPTTFWDDFLREPTQRQNRQIIRPEYSRTYHFGSRGGASKNQFGKIISQVKLNTHIVDWLHEDLSYLESTPFNNQYGQLIKESTLVDTMKDVTEDKLANGNLRIIYKNWYHYQVLAKHFNIMDDEKAKVPRTAYKDVVETRPYGTGLLFICPTISKMKENFPDTYT